MAILVFGSINMDLVARTPRLPAPGETLVGHQFETIPGGKGANQAVAVARLGIPIEMIGRVGDDSFGQELLTSLRQAGVGCDRVFIDRTITSGVAMIAVDDAGENHIIIIAGANGNVAHADVDRLQERLPQATALLLQLEVPIASVIAAAQAARQAGVTVILDPAPAQALPSELYAAIDILTPNQTEAAQLLGVSVDTPDLAAQAAEQFLKRGVKTAIVKLGKQGVICATANEQFHVPAFEVKTIDTVAAGDAFNGGLAAGLAEGLALREAIVWGSATAALSVTKAGAQPSMPSRAEVEAFLHSR